MLDLSWPHVQFETKNYVPVASAKAFVAESIFITKPAKPNGPFQPD